MMRSVQRGADRMVGSVIGPVTHVSTGDCSIALTFDDGPHPEYTPQLLEILGRYGAKATFFVVGEAAGRYREVLRETAAQGHAIGNHSWDHRSFALLTPAERRQQLRRCEEAIAPFGCGLFRPPFGHHTWRSLLDVSVLGYTTVTWDVVGHDWYDRTAGYIAEKIMSDMTAGSVVLLHDALFEYAEEHQTDRSEMLAAVETLLSSASSMFTFVTLPQLLRSGRQIRGAATNMPDAQRRAWLGTLRRNGRLAA